MTSSSECCFHGHEPLPTEYYIVCGECFHVYHTANDLSWEDLKAQKAAYDNGFMKFSEVRDRPANDIYTCPLCAHDF